MRPPNRSPGAQAADGPEPRRRPAPRLTPRLPLAQDLAAWTLIDLAAAWWPWTWLLWQGVGLPIAALALGDRLARYRIADPRVARRMGRTRPLGV